MAMSRWQSSWDALEQVAILAGCPVAEEDLRCQLKQAADQQTIALTITCVRSETPCRGV